MVCVPSFLPLPVIVSTLLLDNLSSLTALLRALDDLDSLFESIEDAYKASLEHDNIAVWMRGDRLNFMGIPTGVHSTVLNRPCWTSAPREFVLSSFRQY